MLRPSVTAIDLVRDIAGVSKPRAERTRKLIRGARSDKVGIVVAPGSARHLLGQRQKPRNGEVGYAVAPLADHQPVDNRPRRRPGRPRSGSLLAADKTVKIGINLPFTGADAHDAELIKDGAMLAIDEANAAGGVGGYKIDVLQLDDGTATAGQYDPAQAATNARKMVSDDSVVAAIGPQMSGSGKAMSPILSQGDLATITPSSTNPDITNPKFAAQYRPGGKAIYFRTVTTDAFQGPNMANYFADTLKVKSVYVLDDSGAYGVGLADAFQAQAKKRGINVLGRDQLNPKEADYTTTLTKIKSLNPDALYYGGVAQAGVKVVKQSYDIIPNIIKAGGDGVYGAEILKGAGFPAAQGWYATIAAPNMLENPDAAPIDRALRQEIRQAARQLLDHRLRRRARHPRRGQAGRRVGQGGDPRRGARRDPAIARQDLAGRGQLRRQRRHREPGHQRLPDHPKRQISARRRPPPVQVYRGGAGELVSGAVGAAKRLVTRTVRPP